jgi:hypothetical protein
MCGIGDGKGQPREDYVGQEYDKFWAYILNLPPIAITE